MKRKTLIGILAFVFCFMAIMPSLAETDQKNEERGTLSAIGGLTQKTGNSYKLWGRADSTVSGNLSIVVVIKDQYGVVKGTTSNTTYGVSVYASKTISLSSGTYTLTATGTSDIDSGSYTRTIIIP